MTRESRIAENIVAKSVKADYGDITLNFNIFDFFTTDNGENMNSEQMEYVESKFRSRDVYMEIEKILRRKIQSTRREWEQLGLKEKR